MSNRQVSLMEKVIRKNWQVVTLLKDGYGVEDIALKTGRPVEAVRGNVRALRECGALKEMFK